MPEPLERLLQRHPALWRGRSSPLCGDRLPSGHALLDQGLGGGWPLGAVTEIRVAGAGCGELSLLLPALRSLAERGERVLWVAPPWLPYPRALQQRGLGPALVLAVPRDADALWAAEQALRSGACGAVLCWPRRLDDRRFRRLQLAAETGRCWAVVFRDGSGEDRSPAALRLAVEARRERQFIRVLKRRGALAGGAIELDRPAGRADGARAPSP